MTPVGPTGPALVALKTTNPKLFAGIVVNVYAQTRSVRLAAQMLQVGERTFYRWLAKFPELKEDAQTGRSRGVDGRVKREKEEVSHEVKDQEGREG